MTNDVPIQLIFVVETTEKVRSDKMYLDALLEHFYNVGENKISYVYLEGKYKYQTPRVIKEVTKLIKDFAMFSKGHSFVIYVFDKDFAHVDKQDAVFVDNVIKYTQKHSYELVWFVKTIEEVMIGKHVKKSEKKEAAVRFLKSQKIKEISMTNLSAGSNVNSPGKSNILQVLDKFKEIKK